MKERKKWNYLGYEYQNDHCIHPAVVKEEDKGRERTEYLVFLEKMSKVQSHVSLIGCGRRI